MSGSHVDRRFKESGKYSHEYKERFSFYNITETNVLQYCSSHNVQVCVLFHSHQREQQKQLAFVKCMDVVNTNEQYCRFIRLSGSIVERRQ